MRKLIISFAAALLAFSAVQAAPAASTAQTFYGPTALKNSSVGSLTIYGPTQLEGVRAENISIMGPLQFKNLEVIKNLEVVGPVKEGAKGRFANVKVTGPLQAEQLTAESLQVIGPVELKEVIIKGDSIIYGPLTASKSRFQNLTITAKDIELDDVTVGNIFIKKDREVNQTLTLDGDTTVNGQIVFESGKGRILLKSKSVVLKGEVRGAILEK